MNYQKIIISLIWFWLQAIYFLYNGYNLKLKGKNNIGYSDVAWVGMWRTKYHWGFFLFVGFLIYITFA